LRSAFFRFLTASMSVSAILVTRYYNNMRDSGLLLFVSLFPYPLRSQTCAYVMRVAVNVPGVTSMGHEVREGHTKKASSKTYTCQFSQDRRSMDKDLNCRRPEYDAGVVRRLLP
jgi:hypothetical protein